MPFINPYNFARIPTAPMPKGRAEGWDKSTGLSGVLECSLINETPLFIPSADSSTGAKEFFTVVRYGPPAIPGTSLKGTFRSLAEAIAGGCSPFGDRGDDAELNRCRSIADLCPCCRLFGFMPVRASGADVMRGRVCISDAVAAGAKYPTQAVTLERFGNPKASHGPFYYTQDNIPRGRKLYWHHPAVDTIQKIPRQRPNAGQNDVVIKPLAPGAIFTFTVRYDGLSEDDLGLLLWTLTPGTLRRHKVGFGKGVGLGTTNVQVLSWRAVADPIAALTQYDQDEADTAPQGRIDIVKHGYTDSYARRLDVPAPDDRDLFQLPDHNLADLDALLTPQRFADQIRYPSFDWFRRFASRSLPTVEETMTGERLPDLRQ